MAKNDWRTRPLSENRRPFEELVKTPGITSALNILLQVDRREPGSLTFVLGPGGAAKTSLSEALPSMLFGHRSEWPIDQIPIVSVSARLPDRGFFTWGALIYALLAQLLDPFRSLDLNPSGIDPTLLADIRRAMSQTTRLRVSGREMWEIFISIARQVRLRHIVIDEANLLMLTQENRTPSDLIEAIRSHAIAIGCTVIFFGTYRLLEVMDFSAQINRRNLNVQIERLQCNTDSQRVFFLSVAEEIGSKNAIPPHLIQENAQWLYETSHGIVGELVEHFARAEILANADGLSTVQMRHLERACHSRVGLERMRFEADEIDRAFSRDYAAPAPAEPPPECRRPQRARRRPGKRKAKRHTTVPVV